MSRQNTKFISLLLEEVMPMSKYLDYFLLPVLEGVKMSLEAVCQSRLTWRCSCFRGTAVSRPANWYIPCMTGLLGMWNLKHQPRAKLNIPQWRLMEQMWAFVLFFLTNGKLDITFLCSLLPKLDGYIWKEGMKDRGKGRGERWVGDRNLLHLQNL